MRSGLLVETVRLHLANPVIDSNTGCFTRSFSPVKKHKDGRLYRSVYELVHGAIPKDKPNICHKCDNPRCFNPSHLFAGTQHDNMLDKVKKQRQVSGSRIHSAILTEEIVERIRIAWESGKYKTRTEVALMFGLRSVRGIIAGTRWRNKDGILNR